MYYSVATATAFLPFDRKKKDETKKVCIFVYNTYLREIQRT